MNTYEVLLRPIITEKSTLLQERGKYVFEVDQNANKAQVKEAVQKVFAVEVSKVNVLNVHPKLKRFRVRLVRGRAWKKAVVTLKPGFKIQLFEGT